MNCETLEVRPKPLLPSVAIIGLLALGCAPFITPGTAHAAESINVWWPTNGAHVENVQPFKALVPGLDVSQYSMYWRVDGGQWNPMASNYADYPHKEASVDVSSWTWHGSGPYVIEFSARQNSTEIAHYTENLYINNGLPTWSPAPTPTTSAPTSSQTSPTAARTSPGPASASAPTNPLSGMTFYVDRNSPAAAQEATWQSSNPYDASLMQTLAAQPTAAWFGSWNANVEGDVQSLVTKAAQSSTVPILVAYNIPQRDCGGFSAGGSDNPAGYKSWINSFAAGIGSHKAVVILEPDALAQMSCLSSQDQATRLALLSYAIQTLKRNANTKIYLDAGHANWIDPTTMANNLRSADVSAADGFSLDVSNYQPTNEEVTYGTQISQQLGGTHFIIDTSRNGSGTDNGQWCNQTGAAIGTRPTTTTSNPLVDAFLWVKIPGESDGYCNGGPAAGAWWPSGALSLVQNAR